MNGRDRFVALMVAKFGRDRWNEHLKIVGNLLNAVAAASVIGALVAPLVNQASATPDVSGALLIAGASFHFAAHLTARYIAGKD
ncbi:MAG: hypothetical protein JNJ73_18080 [Hyphomonadaceae bacterium]|nr:hypothetical protein [Hyphomonadaceae bacterium]